jgi:DNA polymerase-3 subunit alpha
MSACKAGWADRFSAPTFGHKPGETELLEVYKPRLAYELSVLKKLNFSGYFLLVQDIVKFAKTSGILVGPGRGSVGGSLVAYLMGITDCDPIRFGLMFERFINPDRLDLPDADLDFMSERRHEIVDYLIKKYGEARVAGVSNFGTLAAASAGCRSRDADPRA